MIYYGIAVLCHSPPGFEILKIQKLAIKIPAGKDCWATCKPLSKKHGIYYLKILKYKSSNYSVIKLFNNLSMDTKTAIIHWKCFKKCKNILLCCASYTIIKFVNQSINCWFRLLFPQEC